MTVQNEVAWLIDVIQSNYPTAWPDDLVRRNRDDATTYDKPNSPVHEKGVELTNWSVVSVSTGSTNRELYGTTPQYRVEHELDVRVQGAHPEEHGPIASDSEFKTLVRYIQFAIDQEMVYPEVDPDAEELGRITYLDLSIVNETNLSAQAKDYYRTDFTVRMRGNTNPFEGSSDTAFASQFEGGFVG
jgi:hypothetical protein